MCPNICVFDSFSLCCQILDQVFSALSVHSEWGTHCLYTMNEYWLSIHNEKVLIHSVLTMHQTPDPENYYIRRNNRIHRYLETKYNFVLYLILHSMQMYFNYIQTIFNYNLILTLRLLMSYIYIYIYIYGAPILDVSRSHTTTQHSR